MQPVQIKDADGFTSFSIHMPKWGAHLLVRTSEGESMRPLTASMCRTAAAALLAATAREEEWASEQVKEEAASYVADWSPQSRLT